MKNNTHSVRQIVCSCISMLLTALLTVLTYLDPEQVPLAPLLVRMLLLPGLLLVIAGVNFCCLKTGICKLFTGKPDRHTTAVLTVLLAFVLCALGVFPDAAAAAALHGLPLTGPARSFSCPAQSGVRSRLCEQACPAEAMGCTLGSPRLSPRSFSSFLLSFVIWSGKS